MPSNLKSFITGMGTINCAGQSPEELWKNTLEKKSFIREGLGKISLDQIASLDEKLLEFYPFVPSSEIQKLFQNPLASKFTILTLYALGQALQSAAWKNLQAGDLIFFATSTAQIPLWENDLMDYLEGKISSRRLSEALQYEPLGLALQKSLELIGAGACRTFVISSACSASTQALLLASLKMVSGEAKRCLVGSTEVLCQLTQSGFNSLKLLSENPAMPFDENRKGINLSEASAFMCLESEPQKNPLALLSGGAMASDGYHMTSPDPQGKGICRAMQQALHSSGLNAEDVSWIHTHGTGSFANDEAEVKAIQNIFSNPILSSTKPIHGHALAASGILESMISISSLQNNIIPPTAGLLNHAWATNIDFPKNAQSSKVNHVLKNSLGFGGTNAAILLSKCSGEIL